MPRACIVVSSNKLETYVISSTLFYLYLLAHSYHILGKYIQHVPFVVVVVPMIRSNNDRIPVATYSC